jgi:hypothetical protein
MALAKRANISAISVLVIRLLRFGLGFGLAGDGGFTEPSPPPDLSHGGLLHDG